MANIEFGSLRRVCLVVTKEVPPTFRVTTLLRDGPGPASPAPASAMIL